MSGNNTQIDLNDVEDITIDGNLEISQEDVEHEVMATESGLEKYQLYLDGEFRKEAKDFIYKCGLLSSTLYKEDPVKFVNKINTQLDQVKEELAEILLAIDLDPKEHMDGHVDSMFVGLNFVEMNQYLPQVESEILEKHLHINKLQMVGNIYEHIISFPLPKEATDENMIIAAKRIIENNKLKYTSDRDVAYAWRIPVGGRKDGVRVQEVVVDGVSYYSLVDKNGKIRKHRDFVPVDLSDLVGEG